MTIRSRIAPPFYQGAHPRMTQATNPWRLLSLGCRPAPNRTRAASRKWKWPTHCDLHTRCAHALARRRGSRPRTRKLAFRAADLYRGSESLRAWVPAFAGTNGEWRQPQFTLATSVLDEGWPMALLAVGHNGSGCPVLARTATSRTLQMTLGTVRMRAAPKLGSFLQLR